MSIGLGTTSNATQQCRSKLKSPSSKLHFEHTRTQTETDTGTHATMSFAIPVRLEVIAPLWKLASTTSMPSSTPELVKVSNMYHDMFRISRADSLDVCSKVPA